MTLRQSIIIKAVVLIICCFSYTFSTQSSLYKGRTYSSLFSQSVEKRAFAVHILDAANAHDVNPALIAAVIHAESNFKPNARSYAGAQGLMQINGVTARYLKLKNVYDPKSNIEAGTRYLKELFSLFNGRIELVLAAYNAGPGAVKKFKGIPPYKETRKYVAKVLKLYHFYNTGEII